MNDNAKAWVDALRSGEYEQGQKSLHVKTPTGDKFCCLGVACDLAVKAGVPVPDVARDSMGDYDARYYGGEVITYDGMTGVLPAIVQEWLGLKTSGGTYAMNGQLTADNDTGKTFEEIADIIEKQEEKLFV